MNWKFTIACAVLCAAFLNVAAEDDLIFYWRKSGDQKCKPFTQFKIDCNNCICDADGSASCTKMYCMHGNLDFMNQLSKKKKILQLSLQNEGRVEEQD